MKTHPININISENDNDNDNNNNIDKNFVINLNIELSKENKQLRQDIFEANNTISENQEEIHKYDNRVRYMKGFINNLLELKSLYYDIYYNVNTELNQHITQYDNVKNDVYNLIVKIFVCQVFVFISFIILNNNNDRLSLLLFKYILLLFWLFNLTINYFKFYRYCYNFNIKQINNMKNIKSTIKIKLLNINKLESSTISLDNWICEI
jgi:hypothetical protein|tara:strand:+ start:2690 stop:3313 length:624 start_codon:yes stop_codon:yes gene_type:complete